MNLSALQGMSSVNPGIERLGIDNLETRLGRGIPDQYRDLLQAADGFILNNGLHIYSSDYIVERNETFEVNKYAPGYLAIGDDSGGRSILIRFEGGGVYLVDQGSMHPDDMKKVAESLAEWISNGAEID